MRLVYEQEQDPHPIRQPGVLRGRLQLPEPEAPLMAPLPEEERQAIETGLLP